MKSQIFALGALIAAVGTTAHGSVIDVVDANTLTTDRLDDFESYAGGTFPGTNYDSGLVGDGVSYGERFMGQSITYTGLFDVVSGMPAPGPLAVRDGSLGHNLTIWDYLGGNVLSGNGPDGHPLQSGVSEGAVSILFDHDQFEIGLDILGANSGLAEFQFFGRDGSLIDVVNFSELADGAYGFRLLEEMGGIAGVVITNHDIGGIGFDNVRFHSADVPGPGALALLAIAGLVRRRRR